MPKDEEEEDNVRKVQSTPLMRASRLEQKDVIMALLDSQVPACSVDSTGKTALHYLADCSDASISDLLIDHDPSILEIEDCEGITALGLAVIHGNDRLVRRLVERNANLGCRDKEGHSVAHLAAAYGQLQMIDFLESLGVDFCSDDDHGATPLHYAAQLSSEQEKAGSLRVLQKLLSKRVDVDCRDSTQRTPLLWAASSGQWKACAMLLKEGAQVEANDNDGLTALHCAASQGHIRCVEVLLKSGANENSIDRSECTPIFYAITLNHIDCVQALLQSGAQPNHTDIKARSPAHCAATLGSVPILEMLRLKGGDLWMPNQKGNYPIHDAALSKNTDAVKYLLEASKNSSKIINLRSLEGQSLLHLAAMTDNLSLLQYLLDQGAYPNPIVVNNKGKELTPYDVTMILKNIPGMEHLRLFGGIPAADCDERIRMVESQTREEAKKSVDREHKEDEAPSSRSPEEADATEDENAIKDADDGYDAENASGCYALRDGDALKTKAAAIVSNAISRAVSEVEREKSEDFPLRTEMTSRSPDAITREEKTRRGPRLRPPQKKQSKKVYKRLEYDDHAKGVYTLPLPPVFEPGARYPTPKKTRPAFSEENAARLKENARVYGVSKTRSVNSGATDKHSKKTDSKRFNSRAATSEFTATAKAQHEAASEIVKKNAHRGEDTKKGSNTLTNRSSQRLDIRMDDEVISRNVISNDSLDNTGTQSDSMDGNLANNNRVFSSSKSSKRLPRNGFPSSRQMVLPQIRSAADSNKLPPLRQGTTFGPANNSKGPCAEETTSGERRTNDGRKRIEGVTAKTQAVTPRTPLRTSRRTTKELSFQPRRRHRHLIQEYVRVFELKRRTTNDLHEVKRRQMCGQYIDDDGAVEGEKSDRCWIRRLARDHNTNASIYDVDNHVDESQLQDINDIEKQLRSELQRALKDEKWLKTLSRTSYEILPRQNGRTSGLSSAGHHQHVASDPVRQSIKGNYGHDKDGKQIGDQTDN